MRVPLRVGLHAGLEASGVAQSHRRAGERVARSGADHLDVDGARFGLGARSQRERRGPEGEHSEQQQHWVSSDGADHGVFLPARGAPTCPWDAPNAAPIDAHCEGTLHRGEQGGTRSRAPARQAIAGAREARRRGVCESGSGKPLSNADGASCDDGTLCTAYDTCKSGACTAGAQVCTP